MGAGGAGAGAPGRAAPERRAGTLESMCGTIADLRERAASVENAARVVERRIVGPQPAADEDRPDISKVSEPYLVGVVNSDAAAIRAHLAQISNSVERITQELGSVGE